MVYPEAERGGDRRNAKAKSSKETLPDRAGFEYQPQGKPKDARFEVGEAKYTGEGEKRPAGFR